MPTPKGESRIKLVTAQDLEEIRERINALAEENDKAITLLVGLGRGVLIDGGASAVASLQKAMDWINRVDGAVKKSKLEEKLYNKRQQKKGQTTNQEED